MDFGKFKYQQKKRQHKGHAHQIRIKEIRVRPKTGDHDIEVKVSRAREFLEHKDKVIVTVTFRGRELAHIDEGRRVLDQIVQKLEDVGKVEAAPSHSGKRMVCTLARQVTIACMFARIDVDYAVRDAGRACGRHPSRATLYSSLMGTPRHEEVNPLRPRIVDFGPRHFVAFALWSLCPEEQQG